MIRAALLRLPLALAAALLCGAAWAQATPREAALVDLFGRLDFAHCRQLVGVLRDEMPRLFLTGVGRGAKLGVGWRPGNPHWEASYAAVAERLRADEAKNGPLIPVTAQNLGPRFTGLGLTDEDIAFLAMLSATPYGRATVEMLDHLLVAVMAEKLAADQDFSAVAKQQALAVKAHARDNFPNVLKRVTDSIAAQKADAARFDEVMKRSDLNRVTGEQIGKQIFEEPTQRLVRVMYDSFAAINEQVTGFRASPAARETPL